ncbi:MAG: ion channel [Methanoculleus sp.]|uniref:potassium channel family protein n=1 Tax=Methanoculleus sp. TaxID=90427 RepID=UPI0025FC92C5|nr:potassium channel family protein [Methanoculleus sp.]MCK9318377.1 ion channel [Methanoculleus sp.]MDD2254418.1 ion channel [Methanoculleus sp.]MDD4471220.1 ion channel [Methanoculleus sp.]
MRGPLARYLARARAMRFHYLLASLILLLAVYPYVSAGSTGPAALRALTSFVLITGVYAVSDRRRQIAIAALLAVPAFGLGWLHILTGLSALGGAESIFEVLFYAFTAIICLKRVISARRVTSDTISGAVSVYLLMGLTWATAYSLVESITPGSFTTGHPDSAFTFPAFIYYSFVTLATLGYGDITPLTDQARSLAVLETVSGTLYIAVLIARLVAAAGWPTESDEE